MNIEFKRDLQRCFDADIGVKVYPTQLLPNSPMADPAYRARYQIEVDATQTVIGTASYRPADLQVMKHIWRLYTVCESYGMLRYVLRYLQWDHGIPALDYLHTLATHLAERPSAMTTLTLEQRQPYAHPADLIQQSGGTWAGFYAEMAAWTTRVFPVLRDSAFETVFLVNEAVMPVSGRRLPATLRLAYDVVAYYGQHQADTKIQKPLDTYPPGQLIVGSLVSSGIGISCKNSRLQRMSRLASARNQPLSRVLVEESLVNLGNGAGKEELQLPLSLPDSL